MLQGLDDIPWSSLHHAYGSAGDVPGLLRKLSSKDVREVDSALSDLFGNIWHQNTVYEATSHAVPFLVELLMSRETHHRPKILMLLQSIADGSGYLAVHSPDNPEVIVETEHVQQCQEAVNRYLPEFVSLCRDADEAVRQQLPSLLCSIRDGRKWILGHALEEASAESDAFTVANWLFAISHCADFPNDWFERARAVCPSNDPVVHLAFSHLKLASSDDGRSLEGAEEVVLAFLNSKRYDAYFNQCGFTDMTSCGGLEGMFIYLAERLPTEISRKLVKPLCHVAPKLGHITAEMTCEPLLRIAFNNKVPVKGAVLTEDQITLLQQVARTKYVYHAEPTRSIFLALQEAGTLKRIGIKNRSSW